ncbi:hypothetical protein V8E54_013465 [Elaphomyces granulatus]
MHFFKAISVLACAIPLAFATNFHNLSPEFIEVRDTVGSVAYLNYKQYFIIQNGFANTSFSNAYGSLCSPFVFEWNATLPDVYWNLDTTTYIASLTDETQTVIPGTSAQQCSGPSQAPTSTPTPTSPGI